VLKYISIPNKHAYDRIIYSLNSHLPKLIMFASYYRETRYSVTLQGYSKREGSKNPIHRDFPNIRCEKIESKLSSRRVPQFQIRSKLG